MLHSNSQDCVHTLKTGISIYVISLSLITGHSINTAVFLSKREGPGVLVSCWVSTGSCLLLQAPDQGRGAHQGRSGRHQDQSCHVSHVTCQVSGVRCKAFFLVSMVELVG